EDAAVLGVRHLEVVLRAEGGDDLLDERFLLALGRADDAVLVSLRVRVDEEFLFLRSVGAGEFAEGEGAEGGEGRASGTEHVTSVQHAGGLLLVCPAVRAKRWEVKLM